MFLFRIPLFGEVEGEDECFLEQKLAKYLSSGHRSCVDQLLNGQSRVESNRVKLPIFFASFMGLCFYGIIHRR